MVTQHALTRAEPQTVAEARRAVELSRDRLADSLATVESRLVAKKQQLTDRMDVLRPIKKRVRARPWPAVASAIVLGMVLQRVLKSR